MNNDLRSSVVSSRNRGAFQIALLYFLIGGLWILFSDQLAAQIATDQAALTAISIYKGWAYVFVTALMLYWLITRNNSKSKLAEDLLQNAHDELELQVQLRTTALSQANTLLETMLEYMPDQIYFKDTESRFIRNSRAQAMALGVTDPAQIIGKTDFDFFPHAQRSYDEEQEIIRSGQPLIDIEERVVWPNGQATRVSTTKVPLRDQTGQIIGTFGISRDITERKRSEAALLKAKDDLEIKVVERTAELSLANTQLQLELAERKQAEEKLRAGEERLNGIITSAMDAIISVDSEQSVVFFNAAAEKMFGCSAFEAVGGPLERFIPERFRNVHRTHISNFGKTGVTNRAMNALGVILGRRAGGEEFPIEASISQIEIDGKKLYTVILRDITERKQAEEALRERENKLSAIFNLLPVGISILDEDQKLVYVNQALGDILGMTKEGMLRGDYHRRKYLRTDGSLKPAEELASTQAFKEQKAVYNFVTGVEKENGNIIWTNVSAVPVDFPDWKVVTVTSDITERKQAEESLRQSQENFAKAFNSNPAAIAITRLVDGKFISLNSAYTRIMEYEPHEILEHTAAEMNIYVHAEERDQIIRQLREQGAVRNYELLVRTKSGETRSIVVSMEPILYNAEACILSVFIDISERKKMELELQRSNAELEQFAYVASHDLQEPLRAVAGMVQLLQQRYKSKLDGRADEYIGHAVDASTRMQNLINDLLEFSRVERFGKPPAETDLESCLKSALANLQVSIQESNAQITRAPLPVVRVDAAQLTQVLQNLIGNAIKFRGERPLHILIGVKKIEHNWQFEVSDNGIGIEPQYFERIFQVFQRLHTRREYPGTGIGLSLCKKIIERHGGQIWLESQPGAGSTFYFTLPERL